MSEIGFWAVPKEGTRERELLERNIKKVEHDPKRNKRIKQIFKKARALAIVQQDNGAGFPLDKQLREIGRAHV